MSKKCVYTVCVDDYLPRLTPYTLATIRNYADRIGADFKIISERRYPEFPPTYEKLQIHELGKDYLWNILFDCDLLISPEMKDLTQVLPLDTVGTYMSFSADLLFKGDAYFYRDGRAVGLASNIICTSSWCHDLWTPLDFGWDEARTRTKREFIIDEYCLSRNLARFGLKLSGLFPDANNLPFIHFDYTTGKKDLEECVKIAKEFCEQKGIPV